MKYVIDWLVGHARLFVRILGLGAIGSFALAGLVAFRHMLATPQPLDSLLPGEAHLYRWKHGHIYYKVAGEQHAPPVALLHTPELDGSSYEMLGIMATLAAHFRVYALDLLGFGLSDRPGIHYTLIYIRSSSTIFFHMWWENRLRSSEVGFLAITP